MIWVFLSIMCIGVFGTVFFTLELRQTRADEDSVTTASF